MDHFRRLLAPWVIEEEEGWFRAKDTSRFSICFAIYLQDLHVRRYQYAETYLSRDEVRRIAKAISGLPELSQRPQY